MASTSSGVSRSSEAVHHLAPGPEAVAAGAARLGEAGHAALEGVAVQVRHAGQRRRRGARRRPAAAASGSTRGDARRPRSSSRTSRGPAVGQQRLVENHSALRHRPADRRWHAPICLDIIDARASRKRRWQRSRHALRSALAQRPARDAGRTARPRHRRGRRGRRRGRPDRLRRARARPAAAPGDADERSTAKAAGSRPA